jgi:hypothetical protein
MNSEEGPVSLSFLGFFQSVGGDMTEQEVPCGQGTVKY